MRNCAQIGIDDEIFVDSFAGGGGASTGMEVGLGITVAAAINHDPAAILMHKTNHPYLFGVPEERDLKKDDLVLVRNSRGEVPAVCVCDSFSVPENVLEQLQKMYGGKTLKWVIGSVEFLRWE